MLLGYVDALRRDDGRKNADCCSVRLLSMLELMILEREAMRSQRRLVMLVDALHVVCISVA